MVIPPLHPELIATALAQCTGSSMKSVFASSASAPGSGVERFTLFDVSSSSCLCMPRKILKAMTDGDSPAAPMSTLKLMPQAASPAALLRHTEAAFSQLGGGPRGELHMLPS